ncbi:MAG: carboxypeptidase regulatory-like domain-containing protein, partial [Planctomycetes bacterium]|nr:carboxypeptidase regulatory-like domain-containing protein [Planctomycetota bacterium]
PVLLALLALVWWPGEAEAPPPLDSLAEAVMDGDLANRGDADRAAVAAEAAADPGLAAAAAGDNLERDDLVPEAPGPEGPRVLVVRGEPPLPVAGAAVFFVTEADARQRQQQQRLALDRFEQPVQLGQRLTTDANGTATLPASRAPFLCAARQGDDFAFAVLPPRGRTVTMLLQRDETVVLQVTRADGKPGADVPVALLQHFDGRGDAQPVWQAHTDGHGRAEARHFQLLRGNPSPLPAERFLALVQVPTLSPVASEFVGRPAGSEPIVLTLPPLAAVDVRLVDHRGLALLTPATVGIVTEPAWRTVADLPVPRHLTGSRVDKPVGPAAVTLPLVEAGAAVRLFARYANERRPGQLGPRPGPQRADERLALDLPLPASHAVVAGTFVHADGSPVHDPVTAVWWRDGVEQLTLPLPTVADGSFDFVQLGQDTPHAFVLDVRCEQTRSDDTGDHTLRLGARVRVAALPPGQRIELGTVRLLPLPPLVSGVVIDDLGAPIADARITVQQQQAPPANDARAAANWRDVSLLQTRTAADGSFAIDGDLPVGALRVRADTDRHFASEVELNHQGQVVRLQLVRNGILRGRVLLPDWVADGTATLQLVPFEPAARRSDSRGVDLSRRRGGRFLIEPLRPGRFDARITLRNLREPLLVIQDVFVVPGETRDARLTLLDLRQSLQRYRLRAVDQGGQPLRLDGPIRARLANPDGSTSEAGFRWQQGRAELITAAASAELTFFGRGYKPATMTLGPGDHDVFLETQRPVFVEVLGARNLCGPTRRVRVSVVLDGDTGLPGSLAGIDQRTGEHFSFARWDLGRSSGAWLGDSDLVEIPLMQSGTYEVLLRPHQGSNERSPQASIPLGKFRLELDPNGQNVLRVPVDANAVLTALQQLDRPPAPSEQQQQQRLSRRGR